MGDLAIVGSADDHVFMSGIIVTLYIVGFGLVLVSVLMVGPVSKHAIQKMEKNAGSLWAWRDDREKRQLLELDREQMGEETYAEAVSHIHREAEEAMRERARKLDLPLQMGLSFGRVGSAEVASAIRHVGRANTRTAIVALAGGLCSTIASVLPFTQ